jgi:PAS domain S-box-containing protein
MENIPLYNSMIIHNYLEYLRNDYPDLDIEDLLKYAGITFQEVEDRGHWLTQEQVNLFHKYMRRVTQNPHIAEDAGRYLASPKSSSFLRQIVTSFLSPNIAYWATQKVALSLSRHMALQNTSLASNKIEITATQKHNVKEELFQCENRVGMFEAVAKVFTGKYAHVDHPECIHRGDQCCRYIVTWEISRSMKFEKASFYVLASSMIIIFPFVFFLNFKDWLLVFLSAALLSTGVFLFASSIRNKELVTLLSDQGRAADEVVRQINLRYNETLLIREIGEAASSILDPAKLLTYVIHALQKRLSFNRGIVMLANPEKTHLDYIAGFGYAPHEEALLRKTNFSLSHPDSKGVFYRAYKQQKPFLIDSVHDIEKDLSQKSSGFAKDFGVNAFICVPIVYKGKSEGILAVDNTVEKSVPTQSDLSLLMGIAQQIGISLNNAFSHKKLQESEERFRNLSDNSPDIIYQLDQNGKIKYVNPAWEETLGHSLADIDGKYLSDFLRREDHKAFWETSQSILKDKLRVRDKYFTILNAKGLPRYITLTAAPDRDAEGKVIGIVGTIKDISTLRSMEAQLLQASKMEAVGTLTGGIAHDFNNIIQAIMGYNQLMISGRLGNEADMPYLNSIGELITRSRELVRQLLLFSKKVEPLSKVVNINEEIKSIHSLLIKSIPKMIEIKTDLFRSIFSINADATQIGQIIMNLVINARDAMGDSGIIKIKTDNLVLREKTITGGIPIDPGNYVHLSVEDTGCGMDPELTKRIFEPFFTTKEPGKGTGLGLAVVYGIVKNHNGFIYCDSEPDKGTTFHIILPASVTGEEPQKVPEQQYLNAYGTEKILLVDDEKSILETLKDNLKQFGYRIVTAESGEQALEVYNQLKDEISLVILDMNMPGGGGKKCLQNLLEVNRSLKVLMNSGYASAQQREDLKLAGAAGFIHKPFRPEDLLFNIRKILDAPSSQPD